MQDLLYSNCTCKVTHSATAISIENVINSSYCDHRLKPAQFRLQQPFQRSNTSRQQTLTTRHVGAKRQRDHASDDTSNGAAAQGIDQQLQQHIKTIISAHQQLLQRLGPGATIQTSCDESVPTSTRGSGCVHDAAFQPVQGLKPAVVAEQATAAQQPTAVAGPGQHIGFENSSGSQQHAAAASTAATADVEGYAAASSDWVGLAAMKHVLKPKISFSHTLSESINSQQQQQQQHDQMQTVTFNLFNTVVENPGVVEVVAAAYDQELLLPARSAFCMSDLKGIHPFVKAVAARGGASLLVIDPPWENASARRSAAYNTLTPNHMLYLPVKQLVKQAPGSLVALWMTNRPRLHKFVQQELLPAWGLQHVATWLWLKVTDSGEPISPLDSLHRHPFEQIWLLRVQSQEQQQDEVGAQQQEGQVQQQPQQSVVEGSAQLRVQYQGSGDEGCRVGVPEQQQPQLGCEGTPLQQQQHVEPHGVQIAQQQHQQMEPDVLRIAQQQQQVTWQQPPQGAAGGGEVTGLPKHAGQRESFVRGSAEDTDGQTAVDASQASAGAAAAVDHVGIAVVQPPDSHVIISVPGQHSRKPHLGRLLMPYAWQQQQQQQQPAALGAATDACEPSIESPMRQDDSLVCVELFARELFPGWMSWGNEAIKFQTMNYWVKQDTWLS